MSEQEQIKMTVEEADALFAEIADLEIKSAEIAARYDDEIATLKREQTDALSPLSNELKEKIDLLSRYIRANTDRFQKPRKRRTTHGTYGLALSSILQLDPAKEKVLVEYADRHGLELYSNEIKLDKKSITAALREGRQVPGATLITGEVASYKVDMTYKEGGKA